MFLFLLPLKHKQKSKKILFFQRRVRPTFNVTSRYLINNFPILRKRKTKLYPNLLNTHLLIITDTIDHEILRKNVSTFIFIIIIIFNRKILTLGH